MTHRLSIVVLAALAAAAVCASGPRPASAQTSNVDALPTGPILQIETGAHRSTIRDVAIRPDGAVVVTVSDDKTMRLWDAHSGEALQTVRMPIGAGNGGVLNGVDYWPGESHILAAGLTGGRYFTDEAGRSQNVIYLARMSSALEKIDLFKSGGVINGLDAWRPSADSKVRRLASAHGRNPSGVRVVDQRSKVLLEDDLGAAALWVEFAADGRLVAAAENGVVRLYAPDMSRIAEWRAPDGKPAQARHSPSGRRIAVSYVDRARIDILDAQTLRPVAALGGDQRGVNERFFSAVAWRPANGSEELWASGGVIGADDAILVRRWRDIAKPNAFEDVPVSRDAVTRLEATPDGDMIFATGDPAWGRIDGATGRLEFRVDANKADFRRVDQRLFRVSAGAGQVDFAFDVGKGEQRLRFDAATLTLRPAPQAAAGFAAQQPPAGLDGWRETRSPELANGRALRLSNPRDRVRSVTTLTDGRIVVGSDFALTLYSAGGQPLKEKEALSDALAVAASGSGERLVAAHRDGTIRWYDLAPGRELDEIAALFLHGDGERWLLWSPDGHFAHSAAGGQTLAGYARNRGRRLQAEWIDFSQLYSRFYDVDLMRHRVGHVKPRVLTAAAPTSDVADAIARAPSVRLLQVCAVADGRDDVCLAAQSAMRGLSRRKQAAAGAPTTAAPTAVAVRKFEAADRLRLVFEATPGGEDIARYDVFVNDKTTGQKRLTRGLRRKPKKDAAPGAPAATVIERETPIAPGRSEIYVRAYGASGVFGRSHAIAVDVAPPPVPVRPKLYVIAVGVDVYQGDIQDLAFARSDARSVAGKLAAQPAGGYEEVIVVSRFDDKASVAGVESAFAEVAALVRPIDSVAVYVAGHGVLGDDGSYYFVTADVPERARVANAGISRDRLVELLSTVRGKNTIVMVDTCHSGAFTSDTSGDVGNDTGFYVLAAANSEEEALDGFDGRNGVFAHAVLQGLNGAGGNMEGEVPVTQLGLYVQLKVSELAGQLGHGQSAMFHMGGGRVTHFPLTAVQ